MKKKKRNQRNMLIKKWHKQTESCRCLRYYIDHPRYELCSETNGDVMYEIVAFISNLSLAMLMNYRVIFLCYFQGMKS